MWRLNGFTPNTTLAIYFEVANTNFAPSGYSNGPMACGYIQFITQYQQINGQRKLRVTTACRNLIDPVNQRLHLVCGFDQEAAAVLMARMAMFRAENSESVDVLRLVFWNK